MSAKAPTGTAAFGWCLSNDCESCIVVSSTGLRCGCTTCGHEKVDSEHREQERGK